MCMCVLSVMMPSRADTLQWLGDDVTSLSDKVADILKLDVSVTSTPSPAICTTGLRSLHGKVQAEEDRHPEVAFSDSFSHEQRAPPSDSHAQRPTVDVDALSDAVGKLTVVSASAAEANDSRSISSAAVASAAETADAAVTGAVGGSNNDSLLSMLAQFADDTVGH